MGKIALSIFLGFAASTANAACTVTLGDLPLELPNPGDAGSDPFACIRRNFQSISTNTAVSGSFSSSTFHRIYVDTITALNTTVFFSSNVYMAMDFQLVGTLTLPDGVIISAFINTGAVTTAKLASDAVTTSKIMNDSVTEAKLLDSSVTTQKLATDAVTEVKIIDGAVSTGKIEDGAVTTPKIIDGAVRAKLNNGEDIILGGNVTLGASKNLVVSGNGNILTNALKLGSPAGLAQIDSRSGPLELNETFNADVTFGQAAFVSGIHVFGTGDSSFTGPVTFRSSVTARVDVVLALDSGRVGIGEDSPDVDLEVGAAGAGTIHAANYDAHSSRDLKSHIRALTQSDKVAAYNDLKTWEQSDFKRRVLKSTYTYEVWESTHTGGAEILITKAGKKTPVIDDKQPDERGFIAENMSDSIKGNEPLTVSWTRTIMQMGMALQVAIQKIEALEVRVDALEAMH